MISPLLNPPGKFCLFPRFGPRLAGLFGRRQNDSQQNFITTDLMGRDCDLRLVLCHSWNART